MGTRRQPLSGTQSILSSDLGHCHPVTTGKLPQTFATANGMSPEFDACTPVLASVLERTEGAIRTGLHFDRLPGINQEGRLAIK